MSDFRRLNENVLVSPQLAFEDIAAAAALGVTTIVNNRPDGEEPSAPQSDAIEATAAAAQVESTKRALADGESEALVISRRVGDLRTALAAHREMLAHISQEQGHARGEMEATLAAIEAELATARVKRQLSTAGVGVALLSKYDRIALRRQSDALIELRDFYCSACDTAIPLQRRPAYSTGSVIEPCEGCGVLLYHPSGL